MPNEIDSFFSGLPSEDKKIADVFDTKVPEEGKVEEVKETEEESDVRKNRRHRRLEEQLQRERESNIALNERLKVLAEVDRTIKETDGAIDPRLIRVFGTTEEAKEVARHFTDILAETKESAREEALQEMESQQKAQVEEQKSYESLIDLELEALEDQHNVDLTSDAPQARKARREFLEMIQSLSPKDEDGTITGYADFGSTFDIYQSKQTKPDNTRRKEIASISMEKSSNQGNQPTRITPGFRGWETDYNINN